MAVTIPPAKSYTNPVVTLATRYDHAPSEGKRFIPLAIDWGSDASAEGCVDINLYGNAPQTISQIVALAVDNSKCGVDVVFIFPDTNQTYTVAAYEPSAVFPVFTGATQFYVVAKNALANDQTQFCVHNSLPPPSALSRSTFQNSAASGQIAATGNSTTQLVTAGINGTLEELYAFAALDSTASYGFDVFLRDGKGNTMFHTTLAGPNNFQGSFMRLTDASLRFADGMQIFLASTSPYPTNGYITMNAFYRTP